jgi:hypothetical protein
VIMLALGFTVGTILEAILIWIFFAKEWPTVSRSLVRPTVQVIASSVILGVASYWSLRYFNLFFTLDTFSGVLAQGVLSGIVGILAWFTTLKLVGSQELSETVKTLHAKFWKSKPTSPDTTVV